MKYENFKPQYTNVVNGNTALMFLYGVIGEQIDPLMFASEMYYNKQMGRDIMVKINSEGGDVHEGYAMIDAILDTEADTHIVGMAASMAGVISQFGKKRMCNSCGSLMIHGVSGKNKEVVSMVENKLSEMLAHRSKLSQEEIKNIMKTKPEEGKWFNAEDMKKAGLVDEIVPTGIKNPFQSGTKNKFSEKLPKSGKLYEIYAKLIGDENPTPKKGKMELSAIAPKVGLKEDATDEQITNKIDALAKVEAQNKILSSEIENLKTKNAELETAQKAALSSAATVLVENAIKDGKISEDQKSIWIESATENMERTKKQIESMKGTFKSVAASIGASNSGSSNLNADETYESLQQNNPKKLLDIMNNHPEQFEKLQNEYLKKNGVKKGQTQIEA